jgi:hypothetical protein
VPENQEIKNLIKQLNSLGYVQYQLNSIIQETVGTVSLNNLTIEQESELVESLQSYIDFAVKCRKSVK